MISHRLVWCFENVEFQRRIKFNWKDLCLRPCINIVTDKQFAKIMSVLRETSDTRRTVEMPVTYLLLTYQHETA